MKNILTTKEITDAINNSRYGEYDQYHDWSPRYSLFEKLQMFNELLNNIECIETEGKNALLGYLLTLKNENSWEENPIMELYKKVEKY